MLLATDLAALDHHEGTVTLIANAVNWDASDERVDAAYDSARGPDGADDRGWRSRARRPPRSSTRRAGRSPGGGRRRRTTGPSRPPRSTSGPVTPSRSCLASGSRPTEADALDIYRVLRATNPSPYMYLLRLPTAGRRSTWSAPARRRWSRCGTGWSTMHPIAGTRPRGATDEDDVLLAKDLLPTRRNAAST